MLINVFFTFSQNNEHSIFDILNKEIVINNGFAGESLTLVYESNKYYLYRRIFGSGVPYIGTIKYNVTINNIYELTAMRIEEISENIITRYSNDYININIYDINELEVYINDIKKEIWYIRE